MKYIHKYSSIMFTLRKQGSIIRSCSGIIMIREFRETHVRLDNELGNRNMDRAIVFVKLCC